MSILNLEVCDVLLHQSDPTAVKTAVKCHLSPNQTAVAHSYSMSPFLQETLITFPFLMMRLYHLMKIYNGLIVAYKILFNPI